MRNMHYELMRYEIINSSSRINCLHCLSFIPTFYKLPAFSIAIELVFFDCWDCVALFNLNVVHNVGDGIVKVGPI
jgi:hypothetical protein